MIQLFVLTACCQHVQRQQLSYSLPRVVLPKGQTYIWNAPSPYVYNMTVLESDGLKPATPAKLCMVKPRSLEQVAERRLDSSLPLNISIVAHTRFSNKQILVVTSELKLFFIVELHDTLMQRGTFQVTQVGQLAPGERAFIYELNATQNTVQFYFFSRAFSALFYYESHKSDAIKLLAEVSFRPTAHSMFPHPTENRLAFGLVTGQFVSLKYDPADPKTGLTDRKTIGDIEQGQYRDYEYAEVGDKKFIYLLGEIYFLVCEFDGDSVSVVGEFDLGGLTFISLTVEQSTIFLFGQVEGVRDFSIELFLDYNKYELTFIRLSLEDLSIKALTIWDNIMAVAGHKSLRIIPSGEFWNRTVDDRLFHQTEAPIIDLEIIDVTNGQEGLTVHFYLLLTTGAILKSLRLHPMQAKCFGEESSELQFVTTAPFCNGTSVEEFVIRKLPMTVCEETNKVKIKRESRVHYLVDLYIKGGIVGVALLCLCGILCNFRAKVKSLDEVSFSIEFEEYPPSSNLSSSAGEGQPQAQQIEADSKVPLPGGDA